MGGGGGWVHTDLLAWAREVRWLLLLEIGAEKPLVSCPVPCASDCTMRVAI
ncbi:unnamed protein product [Ectocarpus sp. CCAP 1310/34]|nr:unnamed protein product [Ectocarpus sp. CCAP 1310/34]